jgi:hypothetical protein
MVRWITVVLVSVAALSAEVKIIANDGTYLGKLSKNKYDPESVSNKYGQYGSKYSATSINNPYGKYGSKYSSESAKNPYATSSPKLYGTADANTGTDTDE